MLNMCTIVGRAVATYEDRGALFVVVETKNTGKFVQRVSCRFYGDAKKYAEKASHNDLVIVHGEVSSREHKGKWYTEVSGRYLQVEESGQRRAGTHTERSADDDQPGDEDEGSQLGF